MIFYIIREEFLPELRDHLHDDGFFEHPFSRSQAPRIRTTPDPRSLPRSLIDTRALPEPTAPGEAP